MIFSLLRLLLPLSCSEFTFIPRNTICLAFQLWDASTGQAFSQYNEHERRAWSVDFSPVCPTKLASGSDDCSVKLWNINEACYSLSLEAHIMKNYIDF